MSARLNINTPRIRPVFAGVWLMGMGLSGAVVAGVVPEQRAALHPTGQGLQGVMLSPASIAAIAQAPTRVHVQDATGRHKATIIWFDPKLDFALLRTDDVTELLESARPVGGADSRRNGHVTRSQCAGLARSPT